MYGGVRGRKTKVGEKLFRFPPTRFLNQNSLILEAVDWSRNTTGTVHECLATLMFFVRDFSY